MGRSQNHKARRGVLVEEIPRWSQRKGGQEPECEGLACLGEEIRLDPAVSREPREVLSGERGTSGHLSS